MEYGRAGTTWFGPDLRGAMVRGEGFAFATWVLLCRAGGHEEPSSYWSPVMQTALDELVDAFPKCDEAGMPLSFPDRLAREPDSAKARAYFERIIQRSYAKNPPGWSHGEASWWIRVADAWDQIRRSFDRPPQPQPQRVNPLVRQVTPQAALAALARHPGDIGPAVDSEDAMLVEAGLIQCEKLAGARSAKKQPVLESRAKCPRCGEWYFVLRPEDHIVNCPEHPAWKAWEPIRNALSILDGAGGPEAALARESSMENQHSTSNWYIDYSFEKWCRGEQHSISQIWSASGWIDQPNTPPRAVVSSALRAWARMLKPDVACPLCRTPMALEDLAEHLWRCSEHPAFVAVARYGPKLDAGLGGESGELVGLGQARAEAQSTLRALLTACDRFNSDQGWNGEAAYSEAWCERPWHDAIRAATNQVAKLESTQLSLEGISNKQKRRADAFRHEIDSLNQATRDVLDACRTYWSSARDDYNPGHSVFTERADKAWSAALDKAKKVLAASERE